MVKPERGWEQSKINIQLFDCQKIINQRQRRQKRHKRHKRHK